MTMAAARRFTSLAVVITLFSEPHSPRAFWRFFSRMFSSFRILAASAIRVTRLRLIRVRHAFCTVIAACRFFSSSASLSSFAFIALRSTVRPVCFTSCCRTSRVATSIVR